MHLRLVSLFIFILLSLFFLSCVDKPYTYQETYYVTENRTEYRTETYTVTETVPVQSGEEIIEGYSWFNQGTTGYTWDGWWPNYYYVSQPFWYFYYSLPVHSSSNVEIVTYSTFKNVRAYQTGRIEEFARGRFDLFGNDEERYRYWLDTIKYKVETSRIIKEFSTNNDESVNQINTTGIRDLSIFIPGNTGSEFSAFKSVRFKWMDTRSNVVTKERTVPVQVPVKVEKKRDITKTVKVPFWQAGLSN
jgi:hypothetical protein